MEPKMGKVITVNGIRDIPIEWGFENLLLILLHIWKYLSSKIRKGRESILSASDKESQAEGFLQCAKK